METLYDLWDGPADFPAGDMDAALRWLAAEIGLDNALWMGAVRVLPKAAAKKDPFSGWRLRVRSSLMPEPSNWGCSGSDLWRWPASFGNDRRESGPA